MLTTDKSSSRYSTVLVFKYGEFAKWCKNNLQVSLYIFVLVPNIANIASTNKATPSNIGIAADRNVVAAGPSVKNCGTRGPTKAFQNEDAAAATPL